MCSIYRFATLIPIKANEQRNSGMNEQENGQADLYKKSLKLKRM